MFQQRVCEYGIAQSTPPEGTVMKSSVLRIAAIVAATAAFGVSGSAFSESRDAQAQAAALLSRSHTPETVRTYEHAYAPSSFAVDAHASAAALLSGRAGGQRAASAAMAATNVAKEPVDAHAHAAALLRRT
jgi:hypothetical protein